MLQHYVLLKFHDGTSDSHVAAFCERMLAWRGTIREIQHIEIGRDEVHDARSWDLALVMEFGSVDALRTYQRHPEHVALMAFNAPFVADVATVDFTRVQARET